MDGEQLLAPRARTHDLIERQVEGELIVFDRSSNVGHHLTAEVAATWKRCDGETTVSQIAAASQAELGRPVSEDTIWRHLVQLGEAGLLQETASRRPAKDLHSRKSALVKIGIAGTVGVALPLITSIPAARAFNCSSLTNSCVTSAQCTNTQCPCCNPSNKCDNSGMCH